MPTANPAQQRIYDEAKALLLRLERMDLPLMVHGKIQEAAQMLKSTAMNSGIRVGPPGML